MIGEGRWGDGATGKISARICGKLKIKAGLRQTKHSLTTVTEGEGGGVSWQDSLILKNYFAIITN